MKLGGQALAAVAAMWLMTGIVMVFVLLRLYCRAIIPRHPGLDDLAYTLSAAFVLLYTAFIHAAATFGYGQDQDTLLEEDATLAVKLAMIGQSFALLGMATAKSSLGLFLLRIVVARWHRIAIYAVFVGFVGASTVSMIVFWCRCTPVERLYDLRVAGHCITHILPYAILTGVMCVIADFFFAAFPWFFIWNLNMDRWEKITIAGSMSFGILAGACGIFRIIETQGFTSDNHTAIMPITVWSAAEISVTMVCMVIPVLWPVYRRVVLGVKDPSGAYKIYGDGDDGKRPSFNLNAIESNSVSNGGEDDKGFPNAALNLGLRGATTITRITGDNTSEEETLGSEYRRSARSTLEGIQVVDDIRIEYVEHGRLP